MKPAIKLISVMVMALVIVMGVGTTSHGDAKLEQLWAIEKVKKVQYAYAYNLDAGTVEGLMAIFTEDAVAQYSFPAGTFTLNGKQKIKEFLGPYVGTGGAHLMADPYIVVDGNKASGAFYLLRIYAPKKNCPDKSEAGWILGWYNCAFEKVKGDWKIKHMRFSAEATGSMPGCRFKGEWGFQFPPPFDLK